MDKIHCLGFPFCPRPMAAKIDHRNAVTAVILEGSFSSALAFTLAFNSAIFEASNRKTFITAAETSGNSPKLGTTSIGGNTDAKSNLGCNTDDPHFAMEAQPSMNVQWPRASEILCDK
ncbi:hypothetical protein Sjap_002844 [Stephania japonica]|uniref:Uncharacterized protein n=1 Tax=Stephania japonica TaxID=461633 RepID=A0AAP0PUW8_9MAGN